MPFKDKAKKQAYERIYQLEWYKRNKSKRVAAVRKWKQANPDSVKKHRIMEKARIAKFKASAKTAWRHGYDTVEIMNLPNGLLKRYLITKVLSLEDKCTPVNR